MKINKPKSGERSTIELRHVWNIKDQTLQEVPWAERLKMRPMKDFQPDWYKKLSRNVDGESFFSLKLCPSTTTFMNNGMVVTNPADLFVRRESEDDVLINSGIEDNVHIQIHPKEQFGESYPFEDGFMPGAVKFSSMWEVETDVSTTLLFLPCWWNSYSNYIQAYHGMITLNKENQPFNYQINTRLRIPENIGDSYSIPADVPIAQIFFIDVHDVQLSGSDIELYDYKNANPKHAFYTTATHSRNYLSYLKSFVLGGRK